MRKKKFKISNNKNIDFNVQFSFYLNTVGTVKANIHK